MCISLSKLLFLINSAFLFYSEAAVFYLVPKLRLLRIISSQHFREFVKAELGESSEVCVSN